MLKQLVTLKLLKAQKLKVEKIAVRHTCYQIWISES